MKHVALWCLCALTALTGGISLADGDPPFTGPTVATAAVRRDALQAISVEVRAVMNCADISLVSSERLPVDTALPDMSIPGDVRPIAFERWTVTACSRKLTFLMAYWPSEAGTMLWRQSRES